MRYVAFSLLFGCAAGVAHADFKSPDFAYPQTVIKDAEKYLADNDGFMRIKAVMEIVKAKNSVNPDSIFSLPAFVEKMAMKSDDARQKGLLWLYEASLINEIYTRNPYKYNRVPTVATDTQDNPAMWSGAQFKQHSKELVDKALGVLYPYFDEPISSYAEIIEADSRTQIYYPKLRDFLYSKAIDICSDNRSEYFAEIAKMLSPGTAEWAVWAVRDDVSQDELKGLFDKYNSGNCGAYILWTLVAQYINVQALDVPDYLIAYLRDFLQNNHATAFAKELQREYTRLSEPTVSIAFPDIVPYNKEVRLVCKYRNANKIGVKFSQLNTNGNELPGSFVQDLSVLKSDSVKTDTIKVRFQTPASYRVNTMVDNALNDAPGYVLVTPWIPLRIVNDKSELTLVVDSKNGAPAGGVKAELCNKKNEVEKILGETSKSGVIKTAVTSKKDNLSLRLSDKKIGSIDFGDKLRYTVPYSYNPEPYTTSAVMVNQPVYHFGDTVKWSMVVVEKNEKRQKVSVKSNTSVTAVLRDANYTLVDSVAGKTDSYGRFSARFVLPTDVLAGNFSIQTLCDGNSCGSGSFAVSDFKAPVVKMDNVVCDYTSDGYVIKGTAKRYSGGILSAGTVSADIDGHIFKGEIDSSNGNFAIKIPFGAVPDGYYSPTIYLTTDAGENASVQTTLRIGKKYVISGYMSGELNLDGELTLPVYAQNCNGQPVSIPVRWILTDSKTKKTYSGSAVIESAGMKVNWASIVPSNYVLKIEPVDSEDFEGGQHGEFLSYSIERNLVPQQAVCIVPDKTIVAKGNTAEVLVGVGTATYLYVVGEDADGTISLSDHKIKAGFNKIKVPMHGQDVRQLSLIVVDTETGRPGTVNIEIKKSDADNAQLLLSGECMRDKLYPGTKEHWRFRLTDKKGHGADGAMVATMYNEALEKLGILSWPDKNFFSLTGMMNPLRISYPNAYTEHISSITSRFPRRDATLSAPKFMFEPETIRRIMVRGGMNVMSSLDVVPGMSVSKVEDEKPFAYRNEEIVNALWCPEIKFDTDGYAWIEFTVPDFVGTLALKSVAWNSLAQSASLSASFLASKPVMAELSAPKFLRRGDKAVLHATVSNTEDKTINADITIEIFSVVSGKVLATNKFDRKIDAKQQAVLKFEVEATVQESELGIRIKATDGQFADGEQISVPILNSDATVISSQNFVLTKDNPVYSTDVTASQHADDIVALTYCQNPLWEVVKTLPGFFTDQPQSSLQAAYMAYAAMTSRGLLEKYPALTKAIEMWKADTNTQSLVSRLQKNEDLKYLTLGQTPFVGAADYNSQHMQQMALTFNKAIIEKSLKTAIEALAKNQKADGGFSWGNWTDASSPWITKTILATLGQVKRAGFNLELSKEMLDKAFGYIDRNVAKTDRMYSEVYSLYPERKPSTLDGIKCINTVNQDIIKNWKKYSVGEKASSALILWHNGNKAVAQNIMRSLEQFGTFDKSGSLYFASVRNNDTYITLLDAFATILPQNKLSDNLRQWILLQMQTKMRPVDRYTASLVSLLVRDNESWLSIGHSEPVVTIDGKRQNIGPVESATGSIAMRFAPQDSDMTIKVENPRTAHVSYGSITKVSKKQLAEIEPKSSDGLKIEKRFLVKRGNDWVSATSFSKGEVIMVQLILSTDKDLEYVSVIDQHAAGLEVVDQMPSFIYNYGTPSAYKVNTCSDTRLFIDRLPKGVHKYSYNVTASTEGSYMSGLAEFQSQLAPDMTAHSGAAYIFVKN